MEFKIPENSVTGFIDRDCGPHLGRKLLIFAFVFISTWNLTKVPYYLGFRADGDTPYEQGGLTLSINLVHWIDGFQSSKITSPACNYQLLHIALGCTILLMMSLALIKPAWRRLYGKWYFSFALCYSVHQFADALMTPLPPLKILFTGTCILCFVCARKGFKTLELYDQDPVKAEKDLLTFYGCIAFSACAEFIEEATGIFRKVMYRLDAGEWKQYPTAPSPMFGNTLYDWFPERAGMTVFFIFIFVVWFWWPIKLLSIDTKVAGRR